jgi:AsmA protein
MIRIFKILLGLISAVIVLSVLAVVLLPLIYDKDDLKRAIATEVHQQTGRELSIDGALDFSVFPWLALEVSDLSLGSAEDFGDQPFARIGQARVGVALMPLFRKQIAVDEITLDGLELDLVVNARGENNWDDLSGSNEAETASSSGAGSSPFSSQRVAGLNIRESRIDFRDQQDGSHYRLSGFSVQTGALEEGESVPVELTTLFEDLISGKRTYVEMATTVTVDLPAQQYIFDGFELVLTGEIVDASGKDQPVRIKAPHVSADLATQTLQIDAFEAELAVLRADGTLSASKILDDPAFSGTFKAAEFSPAGLMQALQMDVPATADPGALKRAAIRTAFAGNSSQLNLRDFELQLDQSHFRGELIVQNFARPKISFDLAVDAIDLDRYLEPSSDASVQENVAIPQEELRGEEVNGQLSVGKLILAGLDFSDARIGFSIRDGKLRVSPLTANFYGGSYSGDITLDSSGAIPAISLNEKIDSVTFQQLVSDLVDSEALSGMALGHLRVTGSGINSDEVLRSLNGDLGLTLTDGALEGINIWHEIRRRWHHRSGTITGRHGVVGGGAQCTRVGE